MTITLPLVNVVMCSEAVYRGDDYRPGLCDNTARWTVRLIPATATYATVCGVHVRRYRTYPNRYTVEAMQ